jgi:hypothetical protein
MEVCPVPNLPLAKAVEDEAVGMPSAWEVSSCDGASIPFGIKKFWPTAPAGTSLFASMSAAGHAWY